MVEEEEEMEESFCILFIDNLSLKINHYKNDKDNENEYDIYNNNNNENGNDNDEKEEEG